MKKVNLIFFILACFLNSCNGQTTSIDKCQEHLKNAKNAFNSFYKENNQVDLLTALKESELSQDCPETRKGSIEIKISILSLQKEYKRVYMFIDSLSEKDFTKPYKKFMQSNLFKALDCKSKSDIKNRNFYLNSSISEINIFISKQKKIDQEAYYDLFLVKSELLSKDELNLSLIHI
jgi:hypothetical protein